MNYTIKKLKSFMGMDCPGYNATLCLDGKPLAEVIDDGSGGGTMFHWLDYKNRVEAVVLGYDDKPRQCMLTVEEAKLYKYVETLPPTEFQGQPMRISVVMFLEELVNDLEVEKAVKRLLKYPTLFSSDGTISQFKKSVLDDKLRAYIKSKYPNMTLLNDLTMAKAIKAYKAAQR